MEPRRALHDSQSVLYSCDFLIAMMNRLGMLISYCYDIHVLQFLVSEHGEPLAQVFLEEHTVGTTSVYLSVESSSTIRFGRVGGMYYLCRVNHDKPKTSLHKINCTSALQKKQAFFWQCIRFVLSLWHVQ